MNQQVATELLESAGGVVTVANHGAAAVKLLKEGPEQPVFEIVLMDLQMPEMDGYTATRILREDPRFRNLPIVAMTAHALVEERQRCLDAGMNDHVTKPIEPDALFAALKRWVKRRAAGSPAPPSKPAAVADEVSVPEISGVDVAGGLNRVAGNKRLYRSLLEQFAAKQADAAAQIDAALRNGDLELAGRLAHTVKGVAGNLGIASLQLAAEKIERAIRDKQPSVTALLPAFEAEVKRMVGLINLGLGETAPAAKPAAIARQLDPVSAAAALARLRSLIEANDGDASAAFTTVQDELQGVAGKPALDALKGAIDDFDFDAALSRLDEISAQCLAGKV